MPTKVANSTATDGVNLLNIYRIQFISSCPVNGDQIVYSLEVHSRSVISAEEIEGYCIFGPSLHEDLADQLFKKFKGKQFLKARHRGVEIETIRGES